MKYFLLLFGSLTMAACQNMGKRLGNADSASLNSITTDTAEWITYTGKLPCADCEGIITTLTLHQQQKNPDFQFKMKETYQGMKSGKETTFSSEGTYSILRGNAIDPNATVIQLNPDKDRNLQRFFEQVGENELKMLDKDQHTIESSLNYSLKRVP
ncbi:copper homeostasis protein (lipoprotein) [Chitinophaga niastensis]|uniref:Copper homeostasis protein (Lipoprotein) n=1 Tax=Chitinophaga niastensis TaxID=536980 RepID=A0A2P8HT66_CHINA|nr:copper resistance protein NlpE [Chitinophaga niastensis]PSL49413.1 copper homeostasis protein (lipoprotein) [Chitinophaga niastensis]